MIISIATRGRRLTKINVRFKYVCTLQKCTCPTSTPVIDKKKKNVFYSWLVRYYFSSLSCYIVKYKVKAEVFFNLNFRIFSLLLSLFLVIYLLITLLVLLYHWFSTVLYLFIFCFYFFNSSIVIITFFFGSVCCCHAGGGQGKTIWKTMTSNPAVVFIVWYV